MPVYSGLDVALQPDYGAEFPGIFPFTRWGRLREAGATHPR